MKVISIFIIGGAVVLSAVMIVVSAFRELSTLELVLWQIVTLALGVYGSYRFGQNTAKEAARDVIRPHARSALRRILTLRDSLFRISERIEVYKSASDDPKLEIIQAIIHEQIPAGGSAVEDWRDIVPEDVEEILKTWPRSGESGSNGDSD